MKSNERGAGLPGSVAKKLRAIQRRAVGFTFLRGAILAGAVLLAAMLAAMLIDWNVGWFSTTARYTITALALGAALAAFVIWCARPRLAPRRETARAVPLARRSPRRRPPPPPDPRPRSSGAAVRSSSDPEALASSFDPSRSSLGCFSHPLYKAGRGRWLLGSSRHSHRKNRHPGLELPHRRLPAARPRLLR